MNVSFGGNHLIVTNNKAERDLILNRMNENNPNMSKLSYISPIANNKILVVDGKELNDRENLMTLGLCNSRNYGYSIKNGVGAAWTKALNDGYAQKSIIVDLRDYNLKNLLEISKNENFDDYLVNNLNKIKISKKDNSEKYPQRLTTLC